MDLQLIFKFITMKKSYKTKIYILVISTIFLLSCGDILNTKSSVDLTPEDVWSESSLAEAYMYEIYFTFQDAGFTEELQASACDESLFTHGREFRETNAGAVTDINLGWFGKTESGHNFDRMYSKIRSCNEFIEKVGNADFSEEKRNQLKGEAYFLRAYFYHRLTRAFAGVPLQLKVTQLTDSPESFLIHRDSYTDCITQILDDLENASKYLADRTFENTEKGRATLAAVKGLKVRVLADAASDLHDESTACEKVPIFKNYSNKEFLFYTKGTRAERWMEVKKAAADLLNNPMGHSIPTYGGEGLSVEEKAENIWNHFNYETPDHIFSRYFIDTKWESGTNMPLFNGPSGYHAYGGNTPIQSFVDAFLMEDGTKFDWGNQRMANEPYKNREPRFYAFILHDGMKWIDRPKDYQAIDPTGTIQTGYYQLVPNDKRGDYYSGMDTRSGGGETWNATYTGYYLKKFINPAEGDHRNKINCLFPFIRFTEVYMKYIEACIELGELDEAIKYLNVYRNNLGLPGVDSTDKDELRAIYQNECHLEFCFEEHRYWDIRRWMIAPTLEGITSLKGIEVIGTLKPGVGKQERYEHDETRWNYQYNVISLANESRRWLDKLYYLPFHRDEIFRNKNLIQNPGYGEDIK